MRPTFAQILTTIGQLKSELAPDLDLPSSEFSDRPVLKDDLQVSSNSNSPAWQTARFGHNTIDSPRSLPSSPGQITPGGSRLLGTSRSASPSSPAPPAPSLLLSSSSASNSPSPSPSLSPTSPSLSLSPSPSSSSPSSPAPTLHSYRLQQALVQSASLPSIPTVTSPSSSLAVHPPPSSFLSSSVSSSSLPSPSPRRQGLGEHREKNV